MNRLFDPKVSNPSVRNASMPDIDTILASAPAGEPGLLEIASRASHALVEILGSTSCEVWLWRKGADGEPRLARIGSFGPPLPEVESHEAVQQIGERALHGEGHSALGDDQNAARIIQVPLGLHGHAVIALGEAPVTEAMLDWLRRTASDVAEAVARRLPHDELVDMNGWLLKRNEVDRRVASSFAKARTLDELGRTIEQVADELFFVEYSGIYFLDPDSGGLRLVHAKGLTEDERRAAEQTAESRHPGYVLRTGRVVDVRDTSDPSVGEVSEAPSHGKHIRSRMYLPVRVDGVVVGTVGFASTRRAAYSLRHRQGLAFLADFAGLTYARIVAAHENERRGGLLVASHTATERLLGALDWRAAANAVLAMIGSALDAGALALLELAPLEGAAGSPQPVEFTWQPVFGQPWLHGLRLAHLTAAEREQLAAGESVEVAFADMREGAMLKPVMVEGALWGVIAFEPRADRHRTLDIGDRAVLRSLANAFGLAIARERLDETLRQRQKMEALGILASGLAKDFNNLLWPILLYTEMLERSVQLDARMQSMLKDIRTAARGASDLVQQVLAISRRRERLVELVRVADAVRTSVDFLRRSAPAAVELRVSVDQDAGEILGDPGSIEQMLVNLGARAFEAMRGRTGTVRVEASSVARMNRRHVRLVVQDDGPGMDNLTRARLFEPNFGPRQPGDPRSVELGLSVVHRIVTEHDGTITVQSEPTRGTRFEILIPAAQGMSAIGLQGLGAPGPAPASRAALGGTMDASRPVDAPAAPTAAASATIMEAKPGEIVMAVDDDRAVLEVERQMLESVGYRVIACSDPREAVRMLGDASVSVSLLVTDLTMPGLSGIELAEQVRALRPSLPIVCCTGYGDAKTERRGLAAGIKAFVRKPIDLDALAATVRRTIDG